jgi:hypothetical protein
LVQERGVPLAKEFDKIIQRSSYGPRLAKKPRLDSILRSDLEELLEDVFLEAIPRGERDILVDILLPGNPVDLAEKRRLSNYTLRLWLSNAKQEFAEEGDVFEAAQQLPPRARWFRHRPYLSSENRNGTRGGVADTAPVKAIGRSATADTSQRPPGMPHLAIRPSCSHRSRRR